MLVTLTLAGHSHQVLGLLLPVSPVLLQRFPSHFILGNKGLCIWVHNSRLDSYTSATAQSHSHVHIPSRTSSVITISIDPTHLAQQLITHPKHLLFRHITSSLPSLPVGFSHHARCTPELSVEDDTSSGSPTAAATPVFTATSRPLHHSLVITTTSKSLKP